VVLPRPMAVFWIGAAFGWIVGLLAGYVECKARLQRRCAKETKRCSTAIVVESLLVAGGHQRDQRDVVFALGAMASFRWVASAAAKPPSGALDIYKFE
jgi:hypothetical protein